MRALLVAFFALSILLLASCSTSSQEIPPSPAAPATPTAPAPQPTQTLSAPLTREQAIDTARGVAGYIIQDSIPQDIVAARSNGGWVVSFKGLFYPPSGPPPPPSYTPSPRRPLCSEIAVHLYDGTTDSKLTYSPAGSCQ